MTGKGQNRFSLTKEKKKNYFQTLLTLAQEECRWVVTLQDQVQELPRPFLAGQFSLQHMKKQNS
jgi:hypothetical protein